MAFSSQAATRTLERIEVKQGDEENIITVHLNIPVRYVSHVVSESGSEVNLQFQVIQTRDVDMGDLLTTDQLSWNPSAEIPLDKVVFRGEAVGTSSMQVSFATPVRDFQVRQGKNFDVVEFVLKKKKKVVEVPVKQVPTPALQVPETRPPLTFKELPLLIYVVNLNSELTPIDFSKIAPIPVDDDQTLYSTQVVVKGRSWYRLRLGFFRTMEDAKAQLKTMKNFYPNAWIDRADVDEQRQAMELPEGAPLPPPVERVVKPGSGKPKQEQVTPADSRLAKMMELTRRTMTAGEYAKAIRMLEAILEESDNPFDKEARELLGLARERNGQIAHAKAEYRTYLELYPEGEDAKRVNQRLLGLVTATQTPHEPLRKEKERAVRVEWETYGSLSQNYRRDVVDSPFIEEDESVTRSEIDTFVDLNTRRRGEDIDMRMKLTTSYIHDLLDEEQGGEDDSSLSDAYIDLEHRSSRSSMRLGRQRLRSSGVLNRFDGLVLGYELTPDVRVRAVGGLPVERSRDVFLHEHKTFAGINGDISNIIENWDLSLFFIEQRVDDLIDRRAVGGELRYFDPQRSLFSLVDYDIHYGSLNTFMLQGNWTLADETRFYMNLDYRNSPVLMTSNALSSQIDPVTFQAIETIEELQNFYTDDEIYDLAVDRTAKTSTISFGASRPLYPTLQLSGDVTITNTGDTPASGGVEAVEETGNEFFYTLQVIKNDLLKEGDIGIFSLRYSDASTSNTLRLSASSRYPVTNFWRINPKFSVSYRQNDDDDGSRLMVSPFIQMDYRLRKSLTLELETGLNWFEEDDGTEVTNFTDYFFLAGYRWDF
jgi:tetratricopeptide (TPR) repeat protein